MDDISECYRILDLDPGAPREDVRRAYRELVKVWHPDRFRGDPKLQAKAEEKLKRINLAYERLCKEGSTQTYRRTASQTAGPASGATSAKTRNSTDHGENIPQPQAAGAKPAATAARKRANYLQDVHGYWVSAGIMAFLIFMLVMLRKPREQNPHADAKPSASARPGSYVVTELDPIARLRAEAEQGSAQLQFNLGVAYTNGQGVPKDEAEAVRWLRKAAERGLAEAQTNFGVMYYTGRGVPNDYVSAMKWFRKAADQRHASAQAKIGACYALGRGVLKDEAESVKWYQKAAGQGNADAQNMLGIMFSNGQGVSQDQSEAVKWFRQAAEQGDASAQTNLGGSYAFGRGVRKDEIEAVKWYRKAAVQGDASAQMRLKALTNDAKLRHLQTDDREANGSLLVDPLRSYSGKGKLTLDNGLAEDAYVKLVWNGKLAAGFYVRSHEKFTYSTIPDGTFTLLYCTGYGWDASVRNFARGRHARRYDEPISYATRQVRDSTGVTTYTDVMTLTLHKVVDGNAKTSDTSLEEFDRY